MKPLSLVFPIALSLAAATGCSTDQKSAEAASTKSDSAGGLVIPPSTPYRETGAEAPTALVVTMSAEANATPTPTAKCADGKTLPVETVFWLEGIREGKALPNERRYQLESGSCGLEPRLQAAVIGGAINVINDAGKHRLVFLRAGTNDTLQSMPFTLDGSIVSTDRLTKSAGVVEVKCAQHPEEKAYIAVFDHPYFGVAASGDKVTLESVPPGDYRVMTWHEGMTAPTTTTTKVGPTGQTEIVLR